MQKKIILSHLKSKKFFPFLIGILFVVILGAINYSSPTSTETLTSLDLLTPGKYTYLSSENYEEAMRSTVEPYLASYEINDSLIVDDGTMISYKKYLIDDAIGTIVISHGFTEASFKYSELIYYFLNAGYNVYIPDHRSHGLSSRISSDLSLVHITDFNNFVTDFTAFMDTVVIPENKDQNIYLYAHSMGGAIGALYLEAHPNVVKAAILSAPMLDPNLGSYPRWFSSIIANLFTLIGKGGDYVFTHGPFVDIPEEDPVATHSLERYNYMFEKRLKNPYYQTSGASFSWLKEALKYSKQATKNAALVGDTPILLFQAEDDYYVNPEAQIEFVNNAANAELIVVNNAKHELYTECDELLYPYLNTIFNFLEANQ